MSRDAASAILFYSPRTRPTEAWICCCLATKDNYHRKGTTEEAVLTLPLLAHPCAAMLSRYMWMCAKGDILGAKSRICMSSAPISRLFIVTSTVGLEEDTRRAWVVREKGERQTKYCPPGSQNTPPITDPAALVVQNQVGEKVSNSWRWLDLLDRLQTILRQASRSLCLSVVS